MGRTSRSLLGLAAAIATAVTAFAVPAAAHTAEKPIRCIGRKSTGPTSSRISDHWRSLGGVDGPLGCPGKERPNGSGALRQFSRGVIAWSPQVGPGALLTVIDNGRNARGRNITFKWDHMGTHWDFYIVRVVVNPQDGNQFKQFDVARTTPWSGQFTVNTRDVRDFGSTTHGHST
ncbi:hypothetical protein [Nonomuraea sp. NPDC003804]|uniref:LGFP repeat-containing protein n=1 Tax=Nonomuraea sp. NPDC003804 TaxID=3154547 RepID=UPI0033B4A210